MLVVLQLVGVLNRNGGIRRVLGSNQRMALYRLLPVRQILSQV